MHFTNKSTLGPRAQRYLKSWRLRGYTGNYIPVSIIDADRTEKGHHVSPLSRH